MMNPGLRVAVVMGSASDWEVMKHAAAVLDAFAIGHECRVLSAHRMPDAMFAFAADAAARGFGGRVGRRISIDARSGYEVVRRCTGGLRPVKPLLQPLSRRLPPKDK